jgi:phospho-N-acetylmuramoyl-pentapeptide-transferase
MLYHLLYPLKDYISQLNVFRYITFRASWGMTTAILISFLLGPWVIRRLKELRVGQPIRSDGPAQHQKKEGTPTMGGILIILAALIPTLLWARLDTPALWIVVAVTAAMAGIGFWDDWLKVVRRNSKGLPAKAKLGMQFAVGLGIGLYLYLKPLGIAQTVLTFPFFKSFNPDLGFLYIPFAALVIVAAANAVNLTDGLDGLAIGPTIVAGSAYTIIAYLAGHATFSRYLQIIHVPGVGEVAIFGAALVGAALGFLWFNAYPASVFMGDVGSLALGGALGTMALLTKHELLLIWIGGVFVVETLSVIIQVLSFRYSGKRVFRMAPIHHHFELKGWPEPKVIVRFWIISILLALTSLSTLKLR